MANRLGSSTGAPVELGTAAGDAVMAPDGERLLWVCVAYETNVFAEERGDDRVKITRKTFEKIVKNFRNDPQYRFDHSRDVVPWDVGHASEVPPAQRSFGGYSAIGWIREVEIRDGTSRDGKPRAELYALTRWLPKTRAAIQAGEYKFASVTVQFLSNGDNLLSSVAITNQPMLRELPPLAAAQASRTTPSKRGLTESQLTLCKAHDVDPAEYARVLAQFETRK